MAADKFAVCKTFLYGFEPASEHILFDLLVAVFVPDFYVVVVRFYVENAVLVDDEFEYT